MVRTEFVELLRGNCGEKNVLYLYPYSGIEGEVEIDFFGLVFYE